MTVLWAILYVVVFWAGWEAGRLFEVTRRSEDDT